MDRRTGTEATAGRVSVGRSSAGVGAGVGAGAVVLLLMPLLYAVIRRECKPRGGLV
nr:MAG TPA: Mid2 like cell wall stress sensor [Caudoviricetes sp.]